MSGFSQKQLDCKHENTQNVKVGSRKLLRCLNPECRALLNLDKSLVQISVRVLREQ